MATVRSLLDFLLWLATIGAGMLVIVVPLYLLSIVRFPRSYIRQLVTRPVEMVELDEEEIARRRYYEGHSSIDDFDQDIGRILREREES